MVEFTHVLCPIDLGAASERPLAYAAAIARWYESSLTVQHIVPTFDAVPIMSGDFITPAQVIPPVSREDVLAEMRRLAEPITGTERVFFQADEGEATAAILDRALKLPADLLVLGTHARRGMQRLLLGSVTESVLHDAPCPVLAVPPSTGTPLSSRWRPRRLLVPLHNSSNAERALAAAYELAGVFSAEVVLVRDQPYPPAAIGQSEIDRSGDLAVVAPISRRVRGHPADARLDGNPISWGVPTLVIPTAPTAEDAPGGIEAAGPPYFIHKYTSI